MKKKPHKHHDLIIAWAQGAEIEVKLYRDGTWKIVKTPSWFVSDEYRIKPE